MDNVSANKKFYKWFLFFIITLGIILRTYAFIIYRPLWRDECSLALNIYFKNFGELWGVLLHTQSAPPIFMTICKIINSINPYIPEYLLRLFPLISGLVAIFLFYKLSEKVFNSKLAIILANLVFVLNTKLIYFSHEFKQYSTDTAVVLGCILYLANLDISSLNKKQLILNSILLMFIPFLSLPSLFVIGAWIFLNILNKAKIKKIIMISLPLFLTNALYYIFILSKARAIMLKDFSFLWNDGFLKFNIKSILFLIKDNLIFYFPPCKYVLIMLILFISGIILAFKRRNKCDRLTLSAFGFSILASFLRIYPIKDRVSLYLLPLVLIMIILPLDVIKNKFFKYICALFIFLSCVGILNYKITGINNEYSDVMMEILRNNYRYGDYVIFNDVSDSQFKIYSYTKEFLYPPQQSLKFQTLKYDEDWYYENLNMLPKNSKYWFYYSYDLGTKPVIPYLKKWAHGKGKILFEKEFSNNSYLLYLEL